MFNWIKNLLKELFKEELNKEVIEVIRNSVDITILKEEDYDYYNFNNTELDTFITIKFTAKRVNNKTTNAKEVVEDLMKLKDCKFMKLVFPELDDNCIEKLIKGVNMRLFNRDSLNYAY